MIINLPKNDDNKERIGYLLNAVCMMFPERALEAGQLVTEAAKKGIIVEIKPYKASKSRLQENYYRAWCRKFADFCGLTPDEMHDEILGRRFGTNVVSTKMGIKTRPSKRSGRLTKSEYSMLIETLTITAGEMGFVIPPPATTGD